MQERDDVREMWDGRCSKVFRGNKGLVNFPSRALVERSALEKRKALSSSETERGRKGLQPLRCRSVEISLIS